MKSFQRYCMGCLGFSTTYMRQCNEILAEGLGSDTFKDVVGNTPRFCLFRGNSAMGRSDLLIRAKLTLQPLHECTWDFVPETCV